MSPKETEPDPFARLSYSGVDTHHRRTRHPEASIDGLEVLWDTNSLGNQFERLVPLWTGATVVQATDYNCIRTLLESIITKLQAYFPSKISSLPDCLIPKNIDALDGALLAVGEPMSLQELTPADADLRNLIEMVDRVLGIELDNFYAKSFRRQIEGRGTSSNYVYVVQAALAAASEITKPSCSISGLGNSRGLFLSNGRHAAQLDSVLSPNWRGETNLSPNRFIKMIRTAAPWAIAEVKLNFEKNSQSSPRAHRPLPKHLIKDLREQLGSLILWWHDQSPTGSLLPSYSREADVLLLPFAAHFFYVVPFKETYHHLVNIDERFLTLWLFTLHNKITQLQAAHGDQILRSGRVQELIYLRRILLEKILVTDESLIKSPELIEEMKGVPDPPGKTKSASLGPLFESK